MRSVFFEKSKSSGVAVTQPAGCGGENNKFKRAGKYGKVCANYLLLKKMKVMQ
jgi:hypothetical protein